MHKPHTKEISLLLCLPPHSAHLKEAWKGMMHGLLSKYWRHCCRELDYVAEVQQLHRCMVNRGHCPKNLKWLFYEVSCKLKRDNESIGFKREVKLQLDLRKSEEDKDMRKIMLLHQEYHPKDVSRCSLQRIYRDTCVPVFKNLLG